MIKKLRWKRVQKRLHSYAARTNAVTQELEAIRQEMTRERVQNQTRFDQLGSELQEVRVGVDELIQTIGLLSKRLTGDE